MIGRIGVLAVLLLLFLSSVAGNGSDEADNEYHQKYERTCTAFFLICPVILLYGHWAALGKDLTCGSKAACRCCRCLLSALLLSDVPLISGLLRLRLLLLPVQFIDPASIMIVIIIVSYKP